MIKIISKQCVNSKWAANWTIFDGEKCQCMVSCKIRVSVAKNGHDPYTFIVTESEYLELLKNIKEE